MDRLYLNEGGHWVVRETGHVLHSGDPVRLVLADRLVPARIQLDDPTGIYLVIIDGGKEIIPITPELDIHVILDGIL
jgi:hypothetical protein